MTRPAPRLFVESPLDEPQLRLDDRRAHYVTHVLRLQPGAAVTVFNGAGGEREATVAKAGRRDCVLELGTRVEPLPEPVRRISLVQGLVKSDRMDLIVQKATELGITGIVATKTDHAAIRLGGDRVERKLEHWRRVTESACEQCGRHYRPTIEHATSLADVIGSRSRNEAALALHVDAVEGARPLPETITSLTIYVGPEGGFSDAEIASLVASGAAFLHLGRRVLRAETAAIAACVIAQQRWGDLS